MLKTVKYYYFSNQRGTSDYEWVLVKQELLRTLPFRCHKHLLLHLPGFCRVTPISLLDHSPRALGKLSSWLGLAWRASKSLDRRGQASKSPRDTWYTREWWDDWAWGRRWLVRSQERSLGWCYALALVSELSLCSRACFYIFCCWPRTQWKST